MRGDLHPSADRERSDPAAGPPVDYESPQAPEDLPITDSHPVGPTGPLTRRNLVTGGVALPALVAPAEVRPKSA